MQVVLELPSRIRADMLGDTVSSWFWGQECRPILSVSLRQRPFMWGSMSDPRNVAHAKKVTQEKKHQGTEAIPKDAPAVQPGKKPAAKTKSGPAGAAAVPGDTAAAEGAVPSENPTPKPAAALEGSLVVLTKLKELEFHSRANLERLAELALTVEDDLKQKDIVRPLGEVYSAQSALQTKLTALIEAYKAVCDRMQGERV